jgi:hypothetical protein
MGLAAGLVLVAGTAFVLRERATEPFLPQATVDTSQPALPDSLAMSREEVPRVQAPIDVPPLGPVRTADRIVPADAPAPTQSAPAPVLQPQRGVLRTTPSLPTRLEQITMPRDGTPEKILDSPNSISTVLSDRIRELAAVEAEQRAKAAAQETRAEASRQAAMRADASGAESRRAMAPRGDVGRLSGVVVTGIASAPPPAPQPAPAAATAPATSLLVLDGCWRVSAPPALIGVLERPQLRRQSGDTLVLITVAGDLTAIREGDMLRGGVQARRESCPSTP